MSDSLTAVSDAALRFLGRNPRLARALGRDGDATTAFAEADKADRERRSLTNWRGLNESGPAESAPLQHWRGLSLPYNGLRTPKTVGFGITHRDPRQEAVDGEMRESSADRVYLQDPMLFDPPKLFSDLAFDDNPNQLGERVRRALYGTDVHTELDETHVRGLITSNHDLSQAYVNGHSAEARTLETDLANEAAWNTFGLVREDFVAEGPLARLVHENRGGLGDRLMDSEQLRSLVNTDSTGVMLEDRREEVLARLRPELENTGDILTGDFLEEHPLLSQELLRNDALLKWVEEDRDNARELRRDGDLFEARMREAIPQRAAQRVNMDRFDQDWFASNMRVAETVTADDVLDREDPLGTYLQSRRGLLEEEAFAPRLVDGYWAEQAQKAAGDEVPGWLFERSTGLAMMTALHPDVASGLKDDAGAITASFDGEDRDYLVRRAWQAYGLGLGERIYGEYQRVA